MFSKLVRIGRDSELRSTAQGTSVCSIACVYDIGWGDKKRSQWMDAVLWGKQAEALAQYLTKGKQIVIYADDLEIETYEHNGKTGSKLKCRVINVDLTDNKEAQQQQAPQQRQQAPRQVAPQQNQGGINSQFNDNSTVRPDNNFDDDIPF